MKVNHNTVKAKSVIVFIENIGNTDRYICQRHPHAVNFLLVTTCAMQSEKSCKTALSIFNMCKRCPDRSSDICQKNGLLPLVCSLHLYLSCPYTHSTFAYKSSHIYILLGVRRGICTIMDL